MNQDTKQNDLEEVKKLLRESEKEYKAEVERIDNIPVLYKQMRKGVFLFLFCHFLIELIITHFYSWNASFVGPSLLSNYFISLYLIKGKANNWGVNDKMSPFYSGFFISMLVFIVRLVLGFIVGFFLFN